MSSSIPGIDDSRIFRVGETKIWCGRLNPEQGRLWSWCVGTANIKGAKPETQSDEVPTLPGSR